MGILQRWHADFANVPRWGIAKNTSLKAQGGSQPDADPPRRNIDQCCSDQFFDIPSSQISLCYLNPATRRLGNSLPWSDSTRLLWDSPAVTQVNKRESYAKAVVVEQR